MDVGFTHGAGLDVHQKTVMACRVPPDPTGPPADGIRELQPCGTMTRALLALSAWLAEVGVPPVAMESTGAYWRPVYNLLAGHVTIFLVNAAHMKQLPGRKTDKAEARWLAKRMRYGLRQARFIPPQPQRDLRDLTRDRPKLVQERSRAVNRRHGVLERAKIKLAAVATDIMGVSGRTILAVLSQGRADPATMAELAQGRMRTKRPVLEQVLTGLMRDPHRRLLTRQWAHIAFLDEPFAVLSVEITRGLGELEAATPTAPAPLESMAEVARTGDGTMPGPAHALCVGHRRAGYHSWGGPAGRRAVGRRVGHRYGALWHGEPLVCLDGSGPGQRRECGQAAVGQDPPGESHPTHGPDPHRPRRRPDQGNRSVRPVPTLGDPSREETGHHGCGPCDRRQCASHALPPRTVSRAGGQLF
jgi:Transposase